MIGIIKAKSNKYKASSLVNSIEEDIKKAGEHPKVEVSFNKEAIEYSIFGDKAKISKKRIENIDYEVATNFIEYLMKESDKLYLLLDLSL